MKTAYSVPATTKHPPLTKETPRSTARLSRELAAVHRAVADFYGLEPGALTSRDRREPLAEIRLVAMFLCRALTRAPLTTIAASFRRSDHNTIRYAVETVPAKMKKNPSLFITVEKLRKSAQMAIVALK